MLRFKKSRKTSLLARFGSSQSTDALLGDTPRPASSLSRGGGTEVRSFSLSPKTRWFGSLKTKAITRAKATVSKVFQKSSQSNEQKLPRLSGASLTSIPGPAPSHTAWNHSPNQQGTNLTSKPHPILTDNTSDPPQYCAMPPERLLQECFSNNFFQATKLATSVTDEPSACFCALVIHEAAKFVHPVDIHRRPTTLKKFDQTLNTLFSEKSVYVIWQYLLGNDDLVLCPSTAKKTFWRFTSSETAYVLQHPPATFISHFVEVMVKQSCIPTVELLHLAPTADNAQAVKSVLDHKNRTNLNGTPGLELLKNPEVRAMQFDPLSEFINNEFQSDSLNARLAMDPPPLRRPDREQEVLLSISEQEEGCKEREQKSNVEKEALQNTDDEPKKDLNGHEQVSSTEKEELENVDDESEQLASTEPQQSSSKGLTNRQLNQRHDQEATTYDHLQSFNEISSQPDTQQQTNPQKGPKPRRHQTAQYTRIPNQENIDSSRRQPGFWRRAKGVTIQVRDHSNAEAVGDGGNGSGERNTNADWAGRGDRRGRANGFDVFGLPNLWM
ncbi:hypothetical protein GQ44DRAFT_767037 [Phaeosphaeriaceae sp. PMI808]|nr:hypothetical protein GQ44DRAFT_767037 [Phaeosphaeriaceae sp. PMI808]